MLTNLSVRHYKAFESASINLRPITILLGANSVGKSSIIQLFLMLQQTGRAGFKSYKSALKLYGGYINLGDPLNLFRKKDKESPITFTFQLRSKEIKSTLKENFYNLFTSLFFELPMFMPIKGFSELREKPIDNREDFNKYLDAVIAVLEKSTTKDSFRREIRFFLRQRNPFPLSIVNKENRNELLQLYDFITELSKKIKNETFKISYSLKLNDSNNLEIAELEFLHEDLSILKLSNLENFQLSSDLVNFSQTNIKQVANSFQASNTIFNSFAESAKDEDKSDEFPIANFVIKIVSLFQQELQKEFSENNINYVSPLRAHPKRYYMLDKAKVNLTLDTLDGDAITEVLKDNKQITKSVNTWLKNFGVEVDVQGFKEVIHHLVVKQNNIDLDITDVGFGISQILPVIIQGFLSSNNSMTIIEQPEIHLHPKMQADLADLFIDIVHNSSGKKLIIETHSEYLLKRLRRRISEGKISPSDVTICLFTPQTTTDGAKIENLEIQDKGFFDWPVDFYGGEILKDTTEFIKNQNA